MRRSLHHSPFGGFNAIVSQLMDVREQHQHLGRNCSQLSRNKASAEVGHFESCGVC